MNKKGMIGVLRDFKRRIRYWKYLFSSIKSYYTVMGEKKNLLRALREISKYQKYWETPNANREYFYYGLYKKEYTLEEVLKYIPNSAHYKIQEMSRYTQYESLAYDKRYEYLMFNSMNLKHPKVLFYIFNGIITDCNFIHLDYKTAYDMLERSSVKRYFMKPGFSGGTKGTDILRYDDKIIYRMNDNTTTLESLVEEASNLPSGYVIQCEMTDQHPFMERLNPSSINTLRIITYRNKSEFKILRILLRIGREGRPFDNSVAGGVFVNVDPEEFVTAEGCFIEKPKVAYLGVEHPDNKINLKGLKIPYAKEIKEMLRKATEVMFEHTYLGWDVAISNNGPALIEVNISFDIDHHQTAAGKGLRDEMLYRPLKTYSQKNKWRDAAVFWGNIDRLNNSKIDYKN